MDAVDWAHIALCQLGGLQAHGSKQAAASVAVEVSSSGAALQDPPESCSMYFFAPFFHRELPCDTGKEQSHTGAEPLWYSFCVSIPWSQLRAARLLFVFLRA